MKTKTMKIANFVYGYLMKTGKKELDDVWGPEYRWKHTLRVTHWAWRLAVEENADVKKCVISALFHDVSHFVSEDYRKHGDKSAEIARNFLLNEGYSEGFVEDIVYTVKSHVGEHHPKTIEAKILQDADTIDRFGFFRVLLFGKTADLSNLQNLKEKVQSSLEYLRKVEKGDYGQMWTKTGEERLKKLLDINKTIQNGVLEELKNTKEPETYLEH